MIGLDGEGLLEVGVPIVEGLAGDGEDEVKVDVVDAGFADGLDSAGDTVGVVPAFEGLEVNGVERLGADGHAVDTGGDEGVDQFGGDGFGVGFDGELGAGGGVEVVVERGEEFLPERWSEEGWGAAADEYSARRRVAEGREGAHFIDEAIDEGGVAVGVVDDGIEVAVMALVEAKWDVEIEGIGLNGGPITQEGGDVGGRLSGVRPAARLRLGIVRYDCKITHECEARAHQGRRRTA